MLIRSEKKEDKAYIATLIARTYGALGAEIIEQTGALRSLDTYAPELSFVAEDKTPFAYALFTKVKINNQPKGVVLAPFALDLYKQGFDVMAFLNEIFMKVQEQGFSYIFAMGSLEDFSPLRFVYADSLGFSVNQELDATLLVKHLQGETLKGIVTFPSVLTVK
jgi:predicted N-acetyltransferase YhbS